MENSYVTDESQNNCAYDIYKIWNTKLKIIHVSYERVKIIFASMEQPKEFKWRDKLKW